MAIQLDDGKPPLQAEQVHRWAEAWQDRFTDGMLRLTPRIRFAGERTVVILFDDHSGWAEMGEDYLYVGSPSRERALSGRGPMLLRFAPGSVVARTDLVGSRAVWYGEHGGVAVVSNSMRAAVSVIRRFRPNHEALGWMLAAGNLGPGNSWAVDIRKLPPAAEVVLRDHGPPVITKYEVPGVEAVADAAAARALIQDALEPVRGDGPVALLLSGGVDSRVLLGALRDLGTHEIGGVTWGTRKGSGDPLTDSWIAREVAGLADIPHLFLPVELGAGGDPEQVVDRFVRISEGTVDWVAGYVDRFAALRWLATTGLSRVLRGDQCFGSIRITDAVHVRRLVHGEHTADHPILRRWSDSIPEVRLPPEYDRYDGESMSDWRDRLYRSIIIPYTLSPLAEAKAAFVEQYSPFLDPMLVSFAVALPEQLRTGKPILRQIADEDFPGVRLAARPAVQGEVSLLASSILGPWVDASVGSAAEAVGIPAAFAASLIPRSDGKEAVRGLVARAGQFRLLRRLAPARMGRRVRSAVGPLNAPARRIGLRLIIASRALELLADDARAVAHPCAPGPSAAQRWQSPGRGGQ